MPSAFPTGKVRIFASCGIFQLLWSEFRSEKQMASANILLILTFFITYGDLGDFNLCPDDHEYAFRNGDRCCKSSKDCRGIDIKRSSSCCYKEDDINCPNGGNCENCL